MLKDSVLSMFREADGAFLSGEELARRLGVTRAAVWKAVEQLRNQGCEIESVTRRGYRLQTVGDVLSEEGIRARLRRGDLRLRVYDAVSSTNSLLKTLATQDEPAGTALLAVRQTAGRGRRGRSFFSPSGSGLYLSLLLRPALRASEATRLTACAAVAAAEAVEELSGKDAGIKWVNDLYMDGKKICGILTEAGMDFESGQLSYVIVGIGINLNDPEGGFPPELREIAGSVFGSMKIPEARNRLAAGILDRLADYAEDPASPAVFEAYRRRSFVLGREIRILAPGCEPEPAEALDLEPDYALRVRMKDGSVRLLNSGEISIRT